jgi:ABC-2 type transport system permease protein
MSTGTIHDLGYKRYAGVRRDAGTRWRVIMRHQIAMAWKTWWRFKAWLGMAVLISFIAGAFMYSTDVFGHFGRVGQVALMIRDAALPESIGWYCKAAFIASLTLGATVIAGDVQSGAFTFYFARSVRPRDYIAGKLAGLAVVMAVLTMAGPFLLACMRLGLCESLSDALAHIWILPKALAVGALAALAYAALPLGFSALADTRRTALAMWAAYYLIGGFIAMMIGAVTHSGWIAALDIHTAVDGVAERLFDMPALPGKHLAQVSLTAGLTSIVAQVTAAIAIVWANVGRAQRSGIGGST